MVHTVYKCSYFYRISGYKIIFFHILKLSFYFYYLYS